MQKSLLRLIPLCVFLVAILAWNAAVQPADAQNPLDPRFGAVEAFWTPNEATELGIGWERILFYWNQLQPYGPEDWNTEHISDAWLAEAAGRGRTVVGLLKNTPLWATDSGEAAGVPRGLYLPIDDPGNLWATYARRVSSFYGPRGVHHWVIWNEPDIAPGVYGYEFGGTIADYYQLLKVAYQVIKQTDPAATIHLGGLTYWHDPGYLRRLFQVIVADPEAAANGYFFDAVSLHIYFRPETVPMIVGNSFAAQQEMGIDPLKPVWINETNARPSMDPQWPVEVQAFHIDLEQQAWYIVQAYALGFQAGAARIAVYKLVDVHLPPGGESWGLLRPNDFSKRPAYDAYYNTIRYLGGFTYPVRRERTEAYFIISFSRPQGVTRVLWARNPSPVSLKVPAASTSALLVNAVTGQGTPISAVDGYYAIELEGARCHVECLIGGPPLFLVEEGASIGDVPSAIPPPPPTATLSATVTIVAPPTITPTATATNTPQPSPTLTGTPTPTETQTPTSTATSTSMPTPTLIDPTAPPTDDPDHTAAELALDTTGSAMPSAPAAPAERDLATNSWVLAILIGLIYVITGLLFVFSRRRRRT